MELARFSQVISIVLKFCSGKLRVLLFMVIVITVHL